MPPRRRASRSKPVVLVFGESLNDAAAVKDLVIAANSALAHRIRAAPRPVSLTRMASERRARDWVREIDAVINATEATGQRVAAVLVHRDADGPDPDARVEASLGAQLRSLGRAHPVVPIQMIEAWWFLFPDAVESVRPHAWRGTMARRPRDVEAIENPKEVLRQRTRQRGPEYAESDSPIIAQHVRQQNLQPLGRSGSYERLRNIARSIW